MRHWSRPHRTTLVELSVLYVGNLYSSYETHWNEFDAAWQQPTGLMGPVALGLGVYVDNLKVVWGLLDRVWGCMVATHRSHGACWTEFGGYLSATYRSHETFFVLYVGNLQASRGLLGQV